MLAQIQKNNEQYKAKKKLNSEEENEKFRKLLYEYLVATGEMDPKTGKLKKLKLQKKKGSGK